MVFLELRRDSRVTTGNSGCLLCWPIDSDAGRDWGQEEKGTTEEEMAGWHHRLDGREFE